MIVKLTALWSDVNGPQNCLTQFVGVCCLQGFVAYSLTGTGFLIHCMTSDVFTWIWKYDALLKLGTLLNFD